MRNINDNSIGYPLLTVLFIVAVALVFFATANQRPGEPLRYLAAICGASLLLVPMAYSMIKRSGATRHPKVWFTLHVGASFLGAVLIVFHCAGGALISPPGIILAAVIFLVIQGAMARHFLAAPMARQFASRRTSFASRPNPKVPQIAAIIEAKKTLLRSLAPTESEAVFSVNANHVLKHPLLSMRYINLAVQESALVGARRRAGWVLRIWRRLHIAVAVFFSLGLLIHIILVVFFAGYVAGDESVYWWHIQAWGGGK